MFILIAHIYTMCKIMLNLALSVKLFTGGIFELLGGGGARKSLEDAIKVKLSNLKDLQAVIN